MVCYISRRLLNFNQQLWGMNLSRQMIMYYAISSAVLARVFRKASKDDVVWDREELAWRLRNESDLPGRMQ
jgi:hypothetical protein